MVQYAHVSACPHTDPPIPADPDRVHGTAGGQAGRRSDFLGVAAGDWFDAGAVLKTIRGFNQHLVACMNVRLSQAMAMAMIETERTRSPEQRIALSLSRLFWSRTRQLDLTQDELPPAHGGPS